MNFQFNLPVGKWIELDSKLFRFDHRGRDRDRRMVFQGLDDVPRDMTDQELLDLQYGTERRLRVLTDAEASDRLTGVGRPRVTLAANEPGVADASRRRLEYVLAWEEAGCPPRTEAAITRFVNETFQDRRDREEQPIEAKAPSPRQVLRWIADWTRSGREVDSLVPQEGLKGNTSDRLHRKAREILERVVEDRYLVDTRPTAVIVHAHVTRAFEEYNLALPVPDRLATPSKRAVYRTIQRIDSCTLECTRRGRRNADHKYRPVMSAPQTDRHNEVWEIDHTLVDAIVVDDETGLPIGRPWVSAAIDRHTRMITGFHIGFDAPGTYSTMECMRVAVMPKSRLLEEHGLPADAWPCMGNPETLVPDQGKEFKARSFVDGCLMLGTNLQYAPVLKAWYKGKIERFFRTLNTDVFQRVDGTTFSNIFEINHETVPEKVACVTLGELRRMTLEWLVDVYHRRNHRGLRNSPLHAWTESVSQSGMRPMPDPDLVSMALSHVALRVPQRYGIEFEGLVYNSPAVAAYRARPGKVAAVRLAVDPLDLTRIRFVDPADNHYVEVPIQASMRKHVTGITLQKHKLARALQNANSAALGGSDGLAEAYTRIDDAMRERGAATGLGNKRSAAGYWGRLTAARPPEEPPAFDTAASARGVTDGLHALWDDLDPDADRAISMNAEPDENADDKPIIERPRKPRKTRHQQDKATGSADSPPNREDEDDLTVIAASMGMTVRKMSDGGNQ